VREAAECVGACRRRGAADLVDLHKFVAVVDQHAVEKLA
jgi:hypothetical protein